MDLEKLEKLVELMRVQGVQYLETPEVKIYLGPEPARAPSPKVVLNSEDDDPAVLKPKGRVGSLYDHPALRWPGGTRPQLGE